MGKLLQKVYLLWLNHCPSANYSATIPPAVFYEYVRATADDGPPPEQISATGPRRCGPVPRGRPPLRRAPPPPPRGCERWVADSALNDNTFSQAECRSKHHAHTHRTHGPLCSRPTPPRASSRWRAGPCAAPPAPPASRRSGSACAAQAPARGGALSSRPPPYACPPTHQGVPRVRRGGGGTLAARSTGRACAYSAGGPPGPGQYHATLRQPYGGQGAIVGWGGEARRSPVAMVATASRSPSARPCCRRA